MADVEQEMAAARETFVVEAQELLEDLEQGLLHLEADPAGGETVHALFRAVHTLKGSAGLFGFDDLVAFTHVVESLLDTVRAGDLRVTPALVDALLPCADHIAALVHEASGRPVLPREEQEREGAVLLAGLRAFLAEPQVAAAVTPALEPEHESWEISFRPAPDCMRYGMDPLAVLGFLSTLGTVTALRTLADELPEAADLDAATSYLGFEVALDSAAGKTALDEAFDFVREGSRLRISLPEARVPHHVARIHAMPAGSARLGAVLVGAGLLTERELAEALDLQRDSPRASADDDVPLGEVLIHVGLVPRALVDAALGRHGTSTAVPAVAAAARVPDSPSLRVDAGRLDTLIDLVGELVTVQAGAGLQTAAGGVLSEDTLSEMTRLVAQVRDSALALRMVPIGTTFRRFERVTRDVSAELGKDIALVVTGGDTEVDKALVERITDPLMHLVRNALDHGIGTAAERVARGKPAQGTVHLNAFHAAGSIVIEVRDDGRGMDPARILAKAVERGLVPAGTVLSDQEAYALVFEPGFSTADAVSNLSGRGVGMDVVRRNVQELRGSIEVESALGVGTTMRIRLPLTLAIIDGFLISVGASSFVVPLDRVTDCVELPAGTSPQDCMDLRGTVLPFVRLRELFEIGGELPRSQNVLVVEHAGKRVGLVADELLGQLQTVIKPMGELFESLDCISGSTILGNGRAALILDIEAIVEDRTAQERVVARELAGAAPLPGGA